MKIRKISNAVAVALALVLSATACGQSSTPAAPDDGGAKEQVQQEQTSQEQSGAKAESENEKKEDAAGDSAETAAESSEAAAEEVDAPKIYRSSDYIYEADDTGKFDQTLCEGRIEKLSLDNESTTAFPGLARNFSEYIHGWETTANERKTEYTSDNREYRSTITEDETDPFLYSATVTLEQYVRRLDSKCLSILTGLDTYAGGAHGYTEFDSANFDVASGKNIALSEVIPDKQKFCETLLDALNKRYGEDAFFANDGGEGLKAQIQRYADNTYDPDNAVADEYGYVAKLKWTLDADGVTVYFNAYDIAAYAYGTITALIPYTSGLIDQAFVPSEDCSIITQQPEYMTFLTDTNGDEVIEEYNLWTEQDDDNYQDSKAFTVSYGDGEKSQRVETYFFQHRDYLVRAQGNHFIMVDCAGYSDWHEMYTFILNNGDIGQAVTLDVDDQGSFHDEVTDAYMDCCLTDSKRMELANRFDLLSTYNSNKTYYMTADGSLGTDDEYYISDVAPTITSVKPIECEIVDEDGNVTGKETIPEGSSFKIFRTDGVSRVDTRLSDGRIARFELEKDEENWGYKIGGVNAEELFEMLFYAG